MERGPKPFLHSLMGPEVHLWYVFCDRLTDPALLVRYASLLSPAERARQDRLVFARHRHQHLVGRALVRTTLSRYVDVPPAGWAFTDGPYGRPEIAAPEGLPPLCFNLAHSGGLIACVVALDREVGVDVEDTERQGIGLDLARHFFAADEVAHLEALPPARQPEAFFDYWTLKEAYLKARGVGLSLPLTAFAFRLEPVRIAFSPAFDDDPLAWQFVQLRLGPRHKAAVAIRRPPGRDLDLVVQETIPEVPD